MARDSQEIKVLEIEQDGNIHEEEKADLTGDYRNVALLIVLYIFQGLIIGLCAAVPILLQNRGASYKEQAFFSLVYYPFTCEWVIWEITNLFLN